MGGDIPEKYFFTNNLENSVEDMDIVTVNRGSSSQVQYEVDVPGTLLRSTKSVINVKNKISTCLN